MPILNILNPVQHHVNTFVKSLLRPKDMARDITFSRANLQTHVEDCIRFRKDAFLISGLSEEAWNQQCGHEGEHYHRWLQDYIKEHPYGVIHVWEQKHLVGQIEMRVEGSWPPIGYINLIYLTPDARGRGIGQAMMQYASRILEYHGCDAIQLSVYPHNKNAISFYEKLGWYCLGNNPQDPQALLYQFDYSLQ